jgi:hypothetical protein
VSASEARIVNADGARAACGLSVPGRKLVADYTILKVGGGSPPANYADAALLVRGCAAPLPSVIVRMRLAPGANRALGQSCRTGCGASITANCSVNCASSVVRRRGSGATGGSANT